MKKTIDDILNLMSAKYSLDISVYDDSYLVKTVNNRIVELNLKTTDDYVAFLSDNSSESLLLSESLCNSYSEFFRNPLTFLLLEQLILPKLFSDKEGNTSGQIRIWSAGCSAGQEPYSIALLADNFRNDGRQKANVRIFATDRDEKLLQSARKGIYHFSSLLNTRLYFLNKYFSNSGEFYSIYSGIKEIIDFSVLDLLDSDSGAPPSSIYGDFDVVMCSNLLFYYKAEIQKKILNRIYLSLGDGGILVTGEAEVGLVKSFTGFRQYMAPSSIFTKMKQYKI
jgi:chemotaxis methyl-accepting protein methylase